MLSDVMLVASVQSRRIQSHYRDQISIIMSSNSIDHDDESLNANNAKARSLMLELLLPTIQSSLADWYRRWSDEVEDRITALHRGSDAAQRSSMLADAQAVMRIWEQSIRLHLCSFALGDSLSARATALQGAAGDNMGGTALWLVVGAAQGILREFAKLPPKRLRSAPGKSIK